MRSRLRRHGRRAVLVLDAGGEGAVAGGGRLAAGTAFVIRPAAGQQRAGPRGAASRRPITTGSWSVDVLGSPSTAAARRGTSSFISVGMLSTDGNEVAS